MPQSSRERVIHAINFTGPDRVPVMHAVTPAAWYQHGDALYEIVRHYPRDLAAEGAASQAESGAAVRYEYDPGLAGRYMLNDDFVFIQPRHFMYGPVVGIGKRQDEWGCVWHKLDPGLAGQVVTYPLADWEQVKSYRFPDGRAYSRFDVQAIEETIAAARARGKYIIAYAGNLFEKMQWLRGYENLMIDLAEDPDKVRFLAEKVTEFNLETIAVWRDFDVDGIFMEDDWGTQHQLMINPDQWRQIFKPFYATMFAAVRDAGRHVHFHTDGNTLAIIPDLIEIGCHVINPQFSAMDLADLAKVAAGKVCIQSDIDRQYIGPRGAPSEVQDYVRQVIQLFGSRSGGLIAWGEVNSDWPLENVRAMYEAFEAYGHYPIQI